MKLENKYIAIQTLKKCEKDISYYFENDDFDDSEIGDLLNSADLCLMMAIKHLDKEISKQEEK